MPGAGRAGSVESATVHAAKDRLFRRRTGRL